jgi:hypothetical protein
VKLDARNGDTGWPCYDAKRCHMVENVLWVNSGDATWGELVGFDGGPRAPVPVVATHQEERITIYPSRRIVIFNEVDDGADGGEQEPAAVARPLETV